MANKKAKVWNPIKWWTNNMTWLVTCCQLPLNTQISCNFYVHTMNIWKNLLDRYLQFLMVVISPQTNIKTASYDGQHYKHPAHQQTVNFYDLIAFATGRPNSVLSFIVWFKKRFICFDVLPECLSIRRIKYNIPCGVYINGNNYCMLTV